MSRSRAGALILAVLTAGFALLTAACSMTRAPEEQVLTNFFRAARVRDNTTLANISAVTFDPRTDGIVQNYDVANIGEEQRRTLQIRQLTEEEEKARQEDTEFAKRKKEYQDANLEAIERVVKAERSGATVRGRDAEVQAAWTKWRDEQGQYAKRLSEARSKLANERALAVNSLTPPGQPEIDVSNMDVDLITKYVTVSAQVRPPDSDTVTPKTIVFTMQRAVGKTSDGETREGRWIITGIRQDAGAPTTN